MLQKHVNQFYQYQLDYIFKKNSENSTFTTLTTPKEVCDEVETEYKQIFNNQTEFSEQKRKKWFTNLPTISTEDHYYLTQDFTDPELEIALNSTDATSRAGPDNVIQKMIIATLSHKNTKQHF